MAIQIFVIFTPKLGEKIQFDNFFSNGFLKNHQLAMLLSVLEISIKIPILQGGKALPRLPFPSILPSGSGECEQYNQYHSYYHSRGGNVCGFPPWKNSGEVTVALPGKAGRPFFKGKDS